MEAVRKGRGLPPCRYNPRIVQHCPFLRTGIGVLHPPVPCKFQINKFRRYIRHPVSVPILPVTVDGNPDILVNGAAVAHAQFLAISLPRLDFPAVFPVQQAGKQFPAPFLPFIVLAGIVPPAYLIPIFQQSNTNVKHLKLCGVILTVIGQSCPAAVCRAEYQEQGCRQG